MKYGIGAAVRIHRTNGRIAKGAIDKIWRGGQHVLVWFDNSKCGLDYTLRKSNGRHVRKYFIDTYKDYIL